MCRKRLSQLLVCVLETNRTRILIYELQMPELVEEHVIEHESSDSQRRPLATSLSPKLLGSLASHKESRKADAGWQSTKSNLSMSAVDITQSACAPTPIIEVDRTNLTPEFYREATQQDANVCLIDVMDSIRARNRHRKFNMGIHTCLRRYR